MAMATDRPKRLPRSDRSPLPLDDRQIKDATQRFRLIADAPRLRILSVLSQGELTVSDLCKAVGKAQPAVSHHLSLLRISGLIRGERQGKSIAYSLEDMGWAVLNGCREQFYV